MTARRVIPHTYGMLKGIPGDTVLLVDRDGDSVYAWCDESACRKDAADHPERGCDLRAMTAAELLDEWEGDIPDSSCMHCGESILPLEAY